MNLNSFTQKVQEALGEAQNLAVQYGHQQVDAEHLLLALLGQPDGLLPRASSACSKGCPGCPARARSREAST